VKEKVKSWNIKYMRCPFSYTYRCYLLWCVQVYGVNIIFSVLKMENVEEKVETLNICGVLPHVFTLPIDITFYSVSISKNERRLLIIWLIIYLYHDLIKVWHLTRLVHLDKCTHYFKYELKLWKNDIKSTLVKFFKGNMSNDMFPLKNKGTYYKVIMFIV